MKRRYQDPLDPQLVERVLRRISEMSPEDWDRELAWRPPEWVYDPWPPYENGTGQPSQTAEDAAADSPDHRSDSSSPASRE